MLHSWSFYQLRSFLTYKVQLSGATYKFSESYLNWTKEFGLEGSGRVNVEPIKREMPELVSKWDAWHAPRSPDYWQTLLSQVSTMGLTPLDYTGEDFSKIIVPTLILVGDRDALVPVEEAVEMYRLMGQAELAIGPHINHSFHQKVELFTQLVLDFLLRHRTSTDQM